MPAKRVLISIDERLLDRLDRSAARSGLTRSGLIANLASESLDPQHGPGADPEVRAALAGIDRLAEGKTA
ncbi:MAG: hypothetical protein ABIW50_02205 [Candidatus Limnocylindria bacterium]